MSKIVETEFGYHIIQLIEKRGDRINTRHILLRPKVSQKDLDSAVVKLDSLKADISRKNSPLRKLPCMCRKTKTPKTTTDSC